MLPLTAGLCYAIAALFIKKSMAGNIGITRVMFVSNWALFVIYLPLLALETKPFDFTHWHWPVATSIVGFTGIVFSFLSLKVGDVSVATPVLGSKVLFVAVFSLFFLPEKVQTNWWAGAVLTTIAIYLLGGPGHKRKKNTVLCISYALASACFFAIADIMIQRWSGTFGFYRYLVCVAGLIAVESLALIPWFQAPLRSVSRTSMAWLIAGTAFMGIQFFMIAYALSHYGRATAMNIIYSSRGIWSILLVGMFGRWLNISDAQAGKKVMLWRAAGALLLLLAIFLVVYN